MVSRNQIAGVFAAALLACGAEATAPPKTAAAPARKRTVAVAPPTAASYWRGLELSYDPDIASPPLPIDDADLVRDEGTAPLFANLAPADRASLLRDGFAIVKTERARHHIGVFYTDLQEGRASIVLTVDALFELANLGISAAIAEALAYAEKPALSAWLSRVEARLASERKNAPSDLVAPYRVALGFVSVARSLADARYAPEPDVADATSREKANVILRAAIARSPVFGTRIDYRVFPDEPDLRFRAWLALAPFSLGSEEGDRPRVDVERARTNTRAALLLARATDPRIDTQAAAAYARARAIELFLAGSGDDLDLSNLAALARKAGIDLTDGKSIANVVRLDTLRALARASSAPKLLQGEAGGRSIRALAAPAPRDGVAMQELVTPSVPLRSMPSALDVASWLGSEEARREVSARGDDKHAGYARALSSLFSERPTDPHASIYASSLDAISAMLAPSVSSPACPASRSPSFRKEGLDTALSAWTTFRSDFSGVSRARLDKAPPIPSTTPYASPALVYVEPKIEAIASLTALVRQTLNGLDAMKAMDANAPARAVLHDVDELLTVAFEVALLAANDEAPTSTQRAALATLPAWMDSLETAMGSDAAKSAIVHIDRSQHLELEESTSLVETLYLALREPGTKRLVLAVGAHIPHEEQAISMPKAR